MLSVEQTFDALHDMIDSYFHRARSQAVHSNALPFGTERKPLAESCGSRLASELSAAIAIPSCDVSAMDGYALNQEALDLYQAGTDEPIICVDLEMAAGICEEKFKSICNQLAAPWPLCCRIFTGAPVPTSAVTVVMQEYVLKLDINEEYKDQSGLRIKLDSLQSNAIKKDQHIRRCGEEIQKGQPLLDKGAVIHPAHIPLLAAQGLESIEVYRKPTIAVISTGNELCDVNAQQAPAFGEIYDSNRSSLLASLTHLGFTSIDGGIVGDSKAQIRRRIIELSQNADLIIASGGVSVGDYDHIRECIEEIGKIHTYKVAMKPGKPLAIGEIGSKFCKSMEQIPTLFFGLPGNPVSSFVCFELFVKSALTHLQEGKRVDLIGKNAIEATTNILLNKRPGRADYQRVVVAKSAHSYRIVNTFSQQSHRVAALAASNALALFDAQSEGAKPGDRVTCLLHAPALEQSNA